MNGLVIVEGDPHRGPIEDESVSVADAARARGHVVVVTSKRRLPEVLVDGGRPVSLVVGTLPFVRDGLRALGRSLPEPNDYPTALRHFYDRMFWRADMRSVRRWMENGKDPVFIKPVDQQKRFRGITVHSPEDLWQVASVGSAVRVICSNVVQWLTEWRVFVLDGAAAGMRHYDGDPTRAPDAAVVHEIVEAYSSADGAARGCAIDVGIIADSGKTAVVEVNDGFSLGRYGLNNAVYFDLLSARWRQLTEGPLHVP